MPNCALISHIGMGMGLETLNIAPTKNY